MKQSPQTVLEEGEGLLAEAGVDYGQIFPRLQEEVVEAGLCTHCGTCVGLSRGCLDMRPTPAGPLPHPVGESAPGLPEMAFSSCPGRGINYPEMCEYVFGRQPENWLIGCWLKAYIGFSNVSEVRRSGASEAS